MSMPQFRFGIRTLLIVLAVVGLALVLLQNVIMTVGIAEINAAELSLDSEGRVSGTLGWRYARGPSTGVQIHCEIRKLEEQRLLKVKVGERFRFRYRWIDLPWSPKDDPHRKFLSQKVGITETQVVGYVNLAGGQTSVIVDGLK